jgi:hypothetical protein
VVRSAWLRNTATDESVQISAWPCCYWSSAGTFSAGFMVAGWLMPACSFKGRAEGDLRVVPGKERWQRHYHGQLDNWPRRMSQTNSRPVAAGPLTNRYSQQ